MQHHYTPLDGRGEFLLVVNKNQTVTKDAAL